MTTKSTTSRPRQNKPLRRSQTIGIWIFVLTNIFCADEMVPGWEMFHLNWPARVYYIISIVGGGIGAGLVSGEYFIPGLIGGMIAGPGALYAVGRYLASVNVSYSTMDCLVAILGALPGIFVTLILAFVQRKLRPKTPAAIAPPPIPSAGAQTLQ